MDDFKGTVVLDFDGVIHSYKSGWQGAAIITDPPVEGIVDALKAIHESGYEIVVVSTRSATSEGTEAIWKYLADIRAEQYVNKVVKEKPPAIVYIDDRAICFNGHPETLLEKIQSFKPWTAERKGDGEA